MKRLPSISFLIVLCLIAPLLFAQKNGGGGGGGQNQNQNNNGAQGTPTPTVLNMWICNLPGGSYAVPLRSMVSVSSQQYLVDGHTQVTEVDVDTTGCALARFYYLEPNTPTTSGPLGGIGATTIDKAQQLLQQGAAASSQDVWQKVIKNYPTTTHAKTIEYRVQDKSTLTQIYTSAETALQMNQNTVFTPPVSN